MLKKEKKNHKKVLKTRVLKNTSAMRNQVGGIAASPVVSNVDTCAKK